jgi:HK97 family phage prohead protease
MIRTPGEAAAERQQNIAQRSFKPSQRRGAVNDPASRLAGARAALISPEVRAKSDGSGLLEFTGHASVTERGYDMWDMFGPYSEVVSAKAFDATLARADLDTTLNLGHDQLRRIASTVATEAPLTLAMDETGLAVTALRLDPADYDVAYIAPKLRSGLITEMSFAFRIVRGQWSPDYSEYRIEEVDLHRGDVAIVGYGASPHTDGALRETAPKAEKMPEEFGHARSSRARALLELALTD